MHKLLFLYLSIIAINTSASDLFSDADISAGKMLVEKNCISCHASSYGGNGSEIYTRPFRKVESAKALLSQVRACSTNLNLQWFDEEERNAAAYLNKEYYQFD